MTLVSWSTEPWVRALVALAVWCAAAAAGWWWKQPPLPAKAARVSAAAAPSAASQPRLLDTPDDSQARLIASTDPLGLATPARPSASAPGAAASAAMQVWSLAALIVRGPERYAVMTSPGQPPQKLIVGQTLPDGDKVHAIAPDHIELKSPRGRIRSLYLTQP